MQNVWNNFEAFSRNGNATFCPLSIRNITVCEVRLLLPKINDCRRMPISQIVEQVLKDNGAFDINGVPTTDVSDKDGHLDL